MLSGGHPKRAHDRLPAEAVVVNREETVRARGRLAEEWRITNGGHAILDLLPDGSAFL